jgi:ElaB/YqjD/DUF883 family membrane-anchored ribosome-binding protein
MQKLDVWHLVWVLVLVLGVLLLGLTLVIALYNRENSTFASVASIWGLFVGLIGFVVTIYTLFETQRVSRKAQQEIQAATVEAQQAIQKAAREAQEAVKNAQEQTRQVLDRVRHGVREADFSTLHMWVRDLRTAANGGAWHRALLFAEECPTVAERLGNAEGLEDSEREGLRVGADDLRLVQDYIRKSRLGTPTTGLPANHAKRVEALAALLERLGGRLYHEPTKGATP